MPFIRKSTLDALHQRAESAQAVAHGRLEVIRRRDEQIERGSAHNKKLIQDLSKARKQSDALNVALKDLNGLRKKLLESQRSEATLSEQLVKAEASAKFAAERFDVFLRNTLIRLLSGDNAGLVDRIHDEIESRGGVVPQVVPQILDEDLPKGGSLAEESQPEADPEYVDAQAELEKSLGRTSSDDFVPMPRELHDLRRVQDRPQA